MQIFIGWDEVRAESQRDVALFRTEASAWHLVPRVSKRSVSFVIAAVVDADLGSRQTLLEMTSTSKRLQIEVDLLEAELSKLRTAQRNVSNHVQKISDDLARSYESRN